MTQDEEHLRLLSRFHYVVAVLAGLFACFLAGRKRYMFCLIMAGVECVIVPFGTVLGVFTIIVLMRESVKQQFAAKLVR